MKSGVNVEYHSHRRENLDKGHERDIVHRSVDAVHKWKVGKHFIRQRPGFDEFESGKPVCSKKTRERKRIGNDEEPHHELAVAGTHRFIATAPEFFVTFYIGNCRVHITIRI